MAVPVQGLLAILSVLFLSSSPALAASPGQCGPGRRPVIFNFGDSNSDTGGLSAGLGYRFPLPAGRLHFGRPAGRLCDGRLVIDFLCESLSTTYLSPYLEALGSDFSNGANFAVIGSKTMPRDDPFSLHIQVQQFVHFKTRSLDLIGRGFSGMMNEEGFRNALYSIDIGQNDLSYAFSQNMKYDQILQRISLAIMEIRNAIETLFDNGSRHFWIHNTGPLGCLPQKLAILRKDDSDLDAFGCLKTLNNAAKVFNSQLSSLCDQMRSQLSGITLVYTDVYSIKYDLIANYTKYGFDKPLMACCGYGGAPYNYNQNITCLTEACQVCDVKSKFVSWDGVHYTEAANSIVSSKILTTEYSKPQITFNSFCKF